MMERGKGGSDPVQTFLTAALKAEKKSEGRMMRVVPESTRAPYWPLS